jgi:hypothetical protein
MKTFGLNFDPSHLYWQGVSPHVFLSDFRDRVYHVHMKDVAVTLDGKAGILGSHIDFGSLRRGWNFRSLGHGHVNFEEIIRVLNDMDYVRTPYPWNGKTAEWTGLPVQRKPVPLSEKVDFQPSNVKFDEAMANK